MIESVSPGGGTSTPVRCLESAGPGSHTGPVRRAYTVCVRHIEPATREQASQLARLINLAGEGIPEYLWEGMREGAETALDVGARRASRDEGGFSYRNARVCVEDGNILGMVLAYAQPDPLDIGDIEEYPGFLRPLVELEAMAPGSWYVNALATFEAWRGRGVASALLEDTHARAAGAGCASVSLIVASTNEPAMRLYERFGYRAEGERPVVPFGGCLHGGRWVLMCRPVTPSIDT